MCRLFPRRMQRRWHKQLLYGVTRHKTPRLDASFEHRTARSKLSNMAEKTSKQNERRSFSEVHETGNTIARMRGTEVEDYEIRSDQAHLETLP